MSILCLLIPLAIAAIAVIGFRLWLIGAFEGGKSAVRGLINRGRK
jgi:hypothetical protein